MSFTVEWDHVAEKVDLKNIVPRSAVERLCAAIDRFAATGEGDIRRISPTDPRRVRLYVPGAVAMLYLDLDARIVHVGRVFGRAR